jgi:hypothetical protein
MGQSEDEISQNMAERLCWDRSKSVPASYTAARRTRSFTQRLRAV